MLLSITIFSLIGAYIPMLWGDNNGFGGMSLLFGTIGSFVGIWVGWKLSNNFE